MQINERRVKNTEAADFTIKKVLGIVNFNERMSTRS